MYNFIILSIHLRSVSMQVPAIMGVLGVWYNNFFGAQSHALLPYDQVWACNGIPVVSGWGLRTHACGSGCKLCLGSHTINVGKKR